MSLGMAALLPGLLARFLAASACAIAPEATGTRVLTA